jgi:hypothetical protein
VQTPPVRTRRAPVEQKILHQQLLRGTSPPSHSEQGQGLLATVFTLLGEVSSTADVLPVHTPDHLCPPPHFKLADHLSESSAREGSGGGTGIKDWNSGEAGDAVAGRAQVTVAGGWPGSCVAQAGPVDRHFIGRTEAANMALDGFAGDSRLRRGTGRAHVPMLYVRPRSHGNDRQGDFGGGEWGAAGDLRGRRNSAAEECWSASQQERGLSPSSAQFAAGFTDEDTSSSDSDQHIPVMNGAAAWARCWRLAPQGAEWAAGHGAGSGGADTDCSALTRTFNDSDMSKGGSAVDRARGGEVDEAVVGITRRGGTGSVRAKNAGDCVDMALHELPIRCACSLSRPFL